MSTVVMYFRGGQQIGIGGYKYPKVPGQYLYGLLFDYQQFYDSHSGAKPKMLKEHVTPYTRGSQKFNF